jgi:hypothetical protein
MALSPAHYRYALDHPKELTPAMLMGSRVDSIIFETRADEFVVFDGDRRGNEWKTFKARHSDRTILTRDEDDTAHAIAAAVLDNPHAVARLRLAHQQERIRWTIAGRDCVGVPDAHDLRRVSDLKVCYSVNPDRFMWHAIRQGWLGQSCWYADGLRIEQPEISIIAVEPKPPHVVQVYTLSESAREFGGRQWRLYFERLRACEEADKWPGYCESPLPLEAPEDLALSIDGEEVQL